MVTNPETAGKPLIGCNPELARWILDYGARAERERLAMEIKPDLNVIWLEAAVASRAGQCDRLERCADRISAALKEESDA
jgi:hypothetical protein